MLRNSRNRLALVAAVISAYAACYATDACWVYGSQTTCANIGSSGPTDPAFNCNGVSPASGYCTSPVYVYTITNSQSGKGMTLIQCSCQCKVQCNGYWYGNQWCDTGLIAQLATTDCPGS